MPKVHSQIGEQLTDATTLKGDLVQDNQKEDNNPYEPIYFPILNINKVGQNAIWEIIEVMWDENKITSGDNLIFVYAPHRGKNISLKTAKWIGIPNSQQPMRLLLPLAKMGEYWKAFITTEGYFLEYLNRLAETKCPTGFYEYEDEDDDCEIDRNKLDYYTWYRR